MLLIVHCRALAIVVCAASTVALSAEPAPTPESNLPAASPVVSSANVRMQASGATFPQPLYDKLVVEYERLNPSVQISYQGGGSGAGIRAISDKVVAFAASDAPLTAKQIEGLGGVDAIIEVPMVAGGVVPAYNVPGVTEPLKFTGELLADIYMGRVTKWNDSKIADINPGITLPNLAITPVYRSDGSGTTFVFTNYLTTLSEDFGSSVGRGTQVNWPIGIGGKGNPGVAAAVQKTKGALGYMEMNFAKANSIAFGLVKNSAGNFILATPDSITSAGKAAVGSFKGSRLVANIWNQPGDDVYPIAAFTYIIIYKDLRNIGSQSEANALIGFLSWASHEGQKIAKEMDYAPLSEPVRLKVTEALRSATFQGKPVNLPTAAPAQTAPVTSAN